MAAPENHKSIPVEIHFLSEMVSSQLGGDIQETEIVQLVRSGELLVSLIPSGGKSDTSAKKKQEDAHVRLVAAKNCEVSAGGNSILSTVTGYPHIDFKDEDDQQVVIVSVVPLVTVSEDAMRAVLTIHPSVGGVPMLKIEELQFFLKEAGVVYGIDTRLLQKGLEKVTRERQPVTDLVVARGMPPLNGSDAHLRIEVEMGAMPGKIRGDGSIDFRERRMFVSVEEGQIIATKVPETKGIPGNTVFGQVIPQKEGRDIAVRVAEDAVFHKEDFTVRAIKSGVLSIVKDNTIKVSSKQTISGDIDFNTGNIYSKSAVEISGSVTQDFVVAVRGDILIGGHVQSATISSHGNLVVKGGVVGTASNLNIRGDVDIGFIENGTIHAGGNVLIRKSSYYSTIVADGDIIGDQNMKIVGGVIVCSGSLTAGEIGSKNADPASISVGTDIQRYQHYQELHKKILELTKETSLWLQHHGAEAEKSHKMVEMEKDLIEARTELAMLNLIPGSPVHSMTIDHPIDDTAEIVVSGQIYAGTELRIGNVKKTLSLNESKKRFKIGKTSKEIISEPL
jgi:uncharacterized protein